MMVGRGGLEHLDAVACVWAAGVAARDGEPEESARQAARPRLAEILRDPESLFLIVLDEGQVVAFALAEPLVEPATEAGSPHAANVRYVGVLPRLWGSGIGGELIRQLTVELAGAGFQHADLMVYLDNARAVRLYRRHGWRPSRPPATCARTGKPEQRFQLSLGPPKP